MKNIKRIGALLLALCMIMSLGACAIKVAPAKPMSSADEAEALGFEKNKAAGKVAVGEYVFLSVKIRDEYKNEVKWSSSAPEIATVDSNGRVDGIKAGKVTITARAMNATLDFPLTVTKAPAVTLSDTTATFGSASAMAELESNKRSESDTNLYALLINLSEHTVIAYTYDSNGSYTIPVRKMVCATELSEKLIPKHYYYTGSKDRWYQDEDGLYYQFSTKFSDDFRFSSTPYSKEGAASLITESYNSIGTSCTSGDIWLSVADAKWIYENCTEGTYVRAYDRYSTAIAKPVPLKLNGENAEKGWDPTDPSSKNPYKNLTPTFTGVEDITVSKGANFNPTNGVEAFDTCGNKVSKGIKVEGTVNTARPGKYVITYCYTDNLNRTGRADRTVTVK